MEKLRDRRPRSDHEKIEHLVETCYDDVLSYCRRHTGNRDDAQDAAQETFLKFVNAYDRYSDRRKPLAYLFTIARNVCIDMHRSVREEVREDGESWVDDIADETDAIGEVDLDLLIRQLPPELGEVIELRYGQGLRVKEVAAVCGISRYKAMRRIDRALETLRRSFQLERSEKEEVGERER